MRNLRYSKLFGKLIRRSKVNFSDEKIVEEVMNIIPRRKALGIDTVLEIYFYTFYRRPNNVLKILGIPVFYILFPWMVNLIKGELMLYSNVELFMIIPRFQQMFFAL